MFCSIIHTNILIVHLVTPKYVFSCTLGWVCNRAIPSPFPIQLLRHGRWLKRWVGIRLFCSAQSLQSFPHSLGAAARPVTMRMGDAESNSEWRLSRTWIITKVNSTSALVVGIAFRPEVVGSAHNSIQSRGMWLEVGLSGSMNRYWVGLEAGYLSALTKNKNNVFLAEVHSVDALL